MKCPTYFSLSQWNLSFGTPLFKGQKIWCQKNVYIIFVFVTSVEGTPLFWGNKHFLWNKNEKSEDYSKADLKQRVLFFYNNISAFCGSQNSRRGALNNCLWGEAPPNVQPPHPCFYIPFFHEKDTKFVYLLFDKWYPFRMHCT